MEEKNELNDIILNKGGGGSGSKKLLLAIAALTLILIIVLVIMNSLKSESTESAPQVATPPEPTAPTEIIDDPLFEPVEVIQEGNNTPANTEDLGQIAQKIKQESFDNAPVEATVPAPVAQPMPTAQVKAAPKSVQAAPAAAPAVEPKPVVKTPKPVVNTPTIKSVKTAEPKKTSETATRQTATAAAKPAEKVAEKVEEKAPVASAPKAAETAAVVYYIQVGSFTKQPNQALFDRLNASGMKYTTVPSGNVTKVMVGPFQGEKAARDILGTVRRNIEAGAYITKG